MAVEKPELLPLARALDFGRAFYLTTDFEQAAKWARTSVLRRGDGVPMVSLFDVDDSKLSALKHLHFDGPTSDWLRLVSRNRNEGCDDSGMDVVSGPVANDNTMPVLNLYFKGAYTEDEALRRLLTQRFRDQYAFKTVMALDLLDFREAVRV